MSEPAPPVRLKLRRVKVVRYASDGGYAPGEWAKAIAQEHLDPSTLEGEPVRLGIQITKTRAVDVWVRIERVDSLRAKVAAALKRTRSDRMFGSRSALRRAIPGAKRSLAILSAEIQGTPVRVLLAQPKD
jgi:hypothetical protein